jgi:plastocyanin
MHRSPALFLAVSVLVACGGSDSPTEVIGDETGGTSTATLIEVRDNSFSPSTTTVPLGATVTWNWTGATAHNVRFTDGTRSATQSTGSFRRTFTAKGPFQYSCTLHPGMTGTVNVK